MLREEKTIKNDNYKTAEGSIIGQNNSFLDIDNRINIKLDKREIKGAIAGPVKNFDEEINLNDWYFLKNLSFKIFLNIKSTLIVKNNKGK